MQVTSISVNVRYSKQMGDGSFKTLELGCEGALDSEEDWQEVQADLYHQLGDQMRYVFSNSGRAQNGPEKAIQLPPAPLLREHWCQVHQAEYRQFTKEGKTWHSDKAPDGKWCKES